MSHSVLAHSTSCFMKTYSKKDIVNIRSTSVCSLKSRSLKMQVEIKRTIPKGAAPLKDFKTKKIFVGGLPSALKEGIFVFPWLHSSKCVFLSCIVN